MTFAPKRRSIGGPLGLAAAAALLVAAGVMIAAAPVRSGSAAAPASAGRTIDIRLADAPTPRLAPVEASAPLDVRPVAVEAPVSPELASAQAEADARAQAAAEVAQAQRDAARDRREAARIDALLNRPYAPPDPEADRADPGTADD